MAEKLYTIPVNDALEFTLGPSYMEEDIRAMTDKAGFCKEHVTKMYAKGNRLGMALMYQTHTYELIKSLEKIKPESKGGFLKKADNSKLEEYIKKISGSCFICNRIKDVFERYIYTIMYLWKNDNDFKEKYKKSKGFCIEHYGMLIEYASKELSGKNLEEFVEVTRTLFLDNMKRVKEDLDWFIDKFDYRYKDEPWKNSKDALPRMLQKVNSSDIKE